MRNSYVLPCLSSSSCIGAAWAGDGFGSSSPNSPSSGQDSVGIISIGDTGRCGVCCSWRIKPPAESTAASKLVLLQPKMSVYRPPEQKPMAPTLPFESGKRLMYVIAPSKSATACVSGTENIVFKTLSILLGSGEPSRVYISGATARSEEHTSELQSQSNLVCRLLLEKKNT